ncbi:hypothetical protein [Caballeronia sp. LZ035]|uniref:hypothetical protein n=1 Tax=Caballeronia sp. LZ035 TaxID=3038568 RepID=UPI00286439B0|nr:hypothetical protein [Caballeronia sp. LZ035]MDR5760473.1 hypothetical protein [Caballeronia sp. LZ035]
MRVGQSSYPQQTTTDYSDPESHQNLNRVVRDPGGGVSTQEFNGRGKLGTTHDYDVSGKPVRSTGFDPGEGKDGTLTKVKFNADDSHTVSKFGSSGVTSYTVSKDGRESNVQSRPMTANEYREFAQWQSEADTPATADASQSQSLTAPAPQAATQPQTAPASEPMAQQSMAAAPQSAGQQQPATAQQTAAPQQPVSAPQTAPQQQPATAAQTPPQRQTAPTPQQQKATAAATQTAPQSARQPQPPTAMQTAPQQQTAAAQQTAAQPLKQTTQSYLDPDSGRELNRVVTRPDGSRSLISFNDYGQEAARNDYDSSGRLTRDIGYDRNEGPGGTLTVADHKDDGRDVTKASRAGMTNYSVDASGVESNVHGGPLTKQNAGNYATWQPPATVTQKPTSAPAPAPAQQPTATAQSDAPATASAPTTRNPQPSAQTPTTQLARDESPDMTDTSQQSDGSPDLYSDAPPTKDPEARAASESGANPVDTAANQSD